MVIKNKLLLCSAICSTMLSFALNAKEIEMNTAQMQAMDKITGRVSVIDVPVNGEVNFGSFSIVVRACKATPPEETPENYAFVDVADTTQDNQQVNIFKGWMLSSTPALNAIEHPIYDVWLLKCQNGEVDKNLLLSPEGLLDREGMVKLSELKAKEENKDEIIEPQATFETVVETNTATEPVINDTEKLVQEVISQENNIEIPTASETIEVENEIIPTEVAIETAPAEGVPTSLLNLPTVEEKPLVVDAPVEAPTSEPIVPQIEPTTEPVVEDLSSTLTVETDIIPTSSENLPIIETPAEEPALLTEPEVQPASDAIVEDTDVVEEDQFIDLSAEAEALNPPAPELNAEALVTE